MRARGCGDAVGRLTWPVVSDSGVREVRSESARWRQRSTCSASKRDSVELSIRSGESEAELLCREGESIALQGCESIESKRERGRCSIALTEGIRGDSDVSSANMAR